MGAQQTMALYRHRFSLVVTAPIEAIYSIQSSDIQDIISEHLTWFYSNSLIIPVQYSSSVNFEYSDNDQTMIDGVIGRLSVALECVTMITTQEHNRMKLVYPEHYEHIKNTNNKYLKNFLHII